MSSLRVKVLFFEDGDYVEKDLENLETADTAIIIDQVQGKIIYWKRQEKIPPRINSIMAHKAKLLKLKYPTYTLEEKTGIEAVQDYLKISRKTSPYAGTKLHLYADGESYTVMIPAEFAEKFAKAAIKKVTLEMKEKKYEAKFEGQ